mgnify:FL=1
MQTIFVIVGKKVIEAEAMIIGSTADVQTPYGVKKFKKWYAKHAHAKAVITARQRKRNGSRP